MQKCYKCGARGDFDFSLCPGCKRNENAKNNQEELYKNHRELLDQQYSNERWLINQQTRNQRELFIKQQDQEVAEKVRSQILEILSYQENDSTIEQLVAVSTSYPDMTSRILSQIYSNPFRRHLCGKVLFNYGSWENLRALEYDNKKLMEAMISEAETYGRLDWLQKIAEEKRKIEEEKRKIEEEKRKIEEEKRKIPEKETAEKKKSCDNDGCGSCLIKITLVAVVIFGIIYWLFEKIFG
jgi:hypothetical protein